MHEAREMLGLSLLAQEGLGASDWNVHFGDGLAVTPARGFGCDLVFSTKAMGSLIDRLIFRTLE
jgi:hypothetical protein